jgi:hypothetical protein
MKWEHRLKLNNKHFYQVHHCHDKDRLILKIISIGHLILIIVSLQLNHRNNLKNNRYKHIQVSLDKMIIKIILRIFYQIHRFISIKIQRV